MIKIAIVGRPNVGKSTLFNRLIGYRKSITEDIDGVTRDYVYGEFEYRGKGFTILDTGGFDPEAKEGFFPLIRKQIEGLLKEVSAIIFLLDGKEGLMPLDVEIAEILRKKQKPVFYVINKMDSKKRESEAPEFYRLGVGKFYFISAIHGKGIDELLDDISELEEEEKPHIPKEEEINIAIVGRPNTGKSSILNRILGTERMIVSDIPGTTRDAVDSKIVYNGKHITLIDTAGIRRKSKISEILEVYSVARAIKSIERAHVVNLIIDAVQGVSHQDSTLARLIIEKGKGLNIVVNKWDLIDGKISEKVYKENVRQFLPHASFSPVLIVSAKTGKNIERIMSTNLKIYEELKRWIRTSDLNRALNEFQDRYKVTVEGGKEAKIFYGNQIRTFPPTFLLFANFPDLIPEHYKRYLENSMRKRFGLEGTPIRLIFRKK